jgi:predicted DNA-binding transcriptional regulator AlpA
MSLRSELSRSQRATPSRFNKQQNRSAFEQGPLALADNRVLTFPEWCAVNSISPRTGRRLIAAGDGPPVVRLSPRRIGITVRANREWQQSRERA